MLTIKEQQDVRNALANELGATDVRAYITTTFDPRHLEMLRQLPNTLTTADQQAAYVLSFCLDARWPAPPTPALLDTLLQNLVNSGAGALAPLQVRVSQGPAQDPNQSAVNALWVRETLPFFSRGTLRPIVSQLLNSDAQPILRVLGPADSGKSYTKELIDHVCAETRQDVQVVPAEIPEGAAPSYPPEELADTLVTPTIRDVSTRPARSTSSYPAALCRWVLNAAINSPGRWIYVLDGFNQKDVPAETRELVQALAANIASPGGYRRRIRLVLVDYADRLPRVELGTMLHDTIPQVTTLSASEIAACLTAHYDDMFANHGRAKPTAGELLKVAISLLAAAASKPEPLCELNENLTRLRLTDLGRPVPA